VKFHLKYIFEFRNAGFGHNLLRNHTFFMFATHIDTQTQIVWEGVHMKKAALILVLIITAALFSFYIFDPANQSQWIGHQSDEVVESEPVNEPDETVSTDAISAAAYDTAAFYAPETTETQDVIKVVEQTSKVPLEPKGWDLVWSDEFDTPLLNLEYWTEMDRKDNYNKELQYYSPANSYIEDGCLVLTARKENIEGKKYSSGMVDTSEKLAMFYGRIEASISLPVYQGILPAFWMTTDSDMHELDILEMVGKEPGTIYGVYHHKVKGRTKKTYGYTYITDPESFHLYALEWDKDEVRWYVDGEQYYSVRKDIPDEPLYILFTLAVGGVWPGRPDGTTEFPLSMKVDYIRLYNREDAKGENHGTA
jgi:beta-glucanase (GH16 family)